MTPMSVDIAAETQVLVLPLEKIAFNPWQMWPLDPANVAELAESIKAHGLLQRPLARPHPDKPGHVQLAFGHHRRAAAHAAGLAEIAVDVRPLSDLEMADYAIVENFRRRTPTALDKARALQRLTSAPFGLTQAEAGARFGLTQSGVANLLRLLKLPEAVRAEVDAGRVPETMARSLVKLSAALPQAAEAVAKAVAKADEKEPAYVEAFDGALEQHARRFGWSTAGAIRHDKVIAVTPYVAAAAQTLGLNGQFPVCKSCEFFIERDGAKYCVRPPCFDAKRQAVRWAGLAAPAKALGIKIAGADERVSVVCRGQEDAEARRLAAAALAGQDASLRLVPADDKGSYVDYRVSAWRRQALDCEHAALATTDLPALRKAYAPANKPASKQAAPQTAAERERAQAERWKEQEKERRAREAQRAKERKEIERLIGLAAKALGDVLPAQPALLRIIWSVGGWYAGKPPSWAKVGGLAEQRAAAGRALLETYLESDDAAEQAARAAGVPVNVSLFDSAVGFRAVVNALAAELKLKLPAEFNAPDEPAAQAPAQKSTHKAQAVAAKAAAKKGKGKK